MAEICIGVQVPFVGDSSDCFLARLRWYRKCRGLRQRWRSCVGKRRCWSRPWLEQENRELGERIAESESQLAQPQPVTLPLDEIPPGQQFGAGMMALCVNLASQIGLGPRSARSRSFSGGWEFRNGFPPTRRYAVGCKESAWTAQNATKIAGGVWLTDHTNQIGKEKVLTVIRVRNSAQVFLCVIRTWKWWRWCPASNGNVRMWRRRIRKRRNAVAFLVRSSRMARWTARASQNDGKSRQKTVRDPRPQAFPGQSVGSHTKQDSQYEAFTQLFGGTRSALQQTEWRTSSRGISRSMHAS